jgi:hypothetical protein
MRNFSFSQAMSLIAFTSLLLASPTCLAQWSGREKILKEVEKTFGDPPGMTRLGKKGRVWADKKNKRVVVDGYIALNAGQLEMLACLVATKEHESIFAVFSDAQTIHAGLLAVGAKKGEPVKWEPSYTPPSGSEIQVFALWKDKDGVKHNVDARKWVREVGTEDKTLDVNFVFAGSGMWKDPETGEEQYLAESGDLICVSNFSTATLDIPMNSSQVNSGLMFAAFTERIPERETPIRLVLQVVDAARSADKRNNSTDAQPAIQDDGDEEKMKKEKSDELDQLIGPVE